MNQPVPEDRARRAATEHALGKIADGMTIGLGSGRAVFALTELIGTSGKVRSLRAVTASPATQQLAEDAGINVVPLDASINLDVAFDGADEIDGDFGMIKGGGAALLPEKLVLARSRHTVIMVEQVKLVKRLGDTRLLPVEVVRFGWETTRARLLELTDRADQRLVDGAPVVTSEGHYLLDIAVPSGDISELAQRLKLTLGVVEHGLFLTEASEVIVGQSDGTIKVLTRPVG